MHLIEQGGIFELPLFQADNIADMLRSRNEILALMDPNFKEYFQRQQSSAFPDRLPDDFPYYNHSIEVFLLGINHEVGQNDEPRHGVRLFDSTGEIFVRFLPMVIRLIQGIRDPRGYRDYNYCINSTWTQRSVWLRNSYLHDPKLVRPDHEDQYILVDVFNLAEPTSAQMPLEENLPQALPIFGS